MAELPKSQKLSVDRYLSIAAIVLATIALLPDILDIWSSKMPLDSAVSISEISMSPAQQSESETADGNYRLSFILSNRSSRNIAITGMTCNNRLRRAGIQQSYSAIMCRWHEATFHVDGSLKELPVDLMPGSAVSVEVSGGVVVPLPEVLRELRIQHGHFSFANYIGYLGQNCDVSLYDNTINNLGDGACFEIDVAAPGFAFSIREAAISSLENVSEYRPYVEINIRTSEGGLHETYVSYLPFANQLFRVPIVE